MILALQRSCKLKKKAAGSCVVTCNDHPRPHPHHRQGVPKGKDGGKQSFPSEASVADVPVASPITTEPVAMQRNSSVLEEPFLNLGIQV